MKAFLDTSVIVAGLVEAHPHFARAFPLLRDVAGGSSEGWLCAHSVAETFAALTMLPVRPRIHPADARRLVEENLERRFQIVELGTDDYRWAVDRIASLGLAGGVIYDALILRAALRADCERIYTFNLEHFRRVAPEEIAGRLAAP